MTDTLARPEQRSAPPGSIAGWDTDEIPDAFLMLVGDDPVELEHASGAHKRLGLWCSPAKPKDWMGTILVEPRDVCERIAPILSQDFGLSATVFDDEKTARRALDEIMYEGIT